MVFCFGGNDAAQKVERAHSEAILLEARKRWPVFMVGVTLLSAEDMRARCRSLDLAFADLCQRLGVPFLSVFDHLMATPTWLDEARAGDGAHPSVGGYGRMADAILRSPVWQHWMAMPSGHS